MLGSFVGVADYGAFVVAIIVFLLIPGPGNLALITSTSKGGIAGGLGHLAGDHDEPAIAAIGDLADDERQGDGRHELHEPDEAEVEGAARQRIELPPDGNRLHVQGERDENSRRPEQCEGRTSYRQPARGAFGACRGTSVQANVAGCAR